MSGRRCLGVLWDNNFVERPKLIASDVDGTLLAAWERVTPRTVDVVNRVVQADIPFVLATGRPPRWIPPVAEEMDLNGYAVCANGAVVYDIGADRVVDTRGSLDPILLSDIVDIVDSALPGCRFAAERTGTQAIDPDVDSFVIESDYSHPWGDSEGNTVSRAEVLGYPAVKLLVSHPKATSDQMVTALSTMLDEIVSITFSSGEGLLELAPYGVTKASGLAEVAVRLGATAKETISFGDMPNDLAMLEWSGHGVAMANAHPRVLDTADEITAPNTEDGVAQVLERWF